MLFNCHLPQWESSFFFFFFWVLVSLTHRHRLWVVEFLIPLNDSYLTSLPLLTLLLVRIFLVMASFSTFFIFYFFLFIFLFLLNARQLRQDLSETIQTLGLTYANILWETKPTESHTACSARHIYIYIYIYSNKFIYTLNILGAVRFSMVCISQRR